MNAPLDQDDQVTLAVVSAELKHMSKTLDQLAADMRADRAAYVTRSEFDQRTGHVDDQIAQMRDNIASKRAPWWAVGSLALAAVIVLVDVIPILSR